MIGRASVLALLALTTTGCGSPPVERVTESRSEAIVDGTPVTEGWDIIVRVAVKGKTGCTGVLVAPNLVLTVRHCVAETEFFGLLDCDPFDPFKSIATLGANFPEVEVFHGLDAAPGSDKPPSAVSKATFTPKDTDFCSQDIALLLLDRELPLAEQPPIHIDPDPELVLGEPIRTAGWGVVDVKGTATTVMREREGSLLVVGPATYRRVPWPELRVIDSLLLFEGGICGGDSGSPAVRQSTGAIFALAHLVYNLDFTKAGIKDFTKPWLICEGDTNVTSATDISHHRDLILSAFAESGYAPRLDGRPPPSAFGGTCEIAEDCHTGLCLRSGQEQFCSHSCENQACPADYTCAFAAGGEKYCIAQVGGGDEGCAVGTRGRNAGELAVLLLVVAAALGRRRRS